METKEIEALAAKAESKAIAGVSEAFKEYEGDRKQRKTQAGKREKKKSSGELLDVNKATVPFCRDIVKSAVAYLLGNPPTLKPSEENEVSEVIKNIWHKNRMDAKLVEFAEVVKSEKIGALVFYLNEANEIKTRVLSYRSGLLLPVFDEFGDLTAFGWKYKDDKGKDKMHLFTSEWTYVLENKEGWKVDEDLSEENPFGKIPVVFLQQENTEWHNVEWAIDRYEVLLSIQADINDEFGSPKYKMKGKVNRDSKDPRTIRLDILETEKGNIVEADIDIIRAPDAVDAIRLEMDSLIGIIYEQTQTVRANFESVKGIGNISNKAMELLYQPAVLKARNAESDYEVVIDRCLNVIKAGVGYLTDNKIPPYNRLSREELYTLTHTVRFNSILPKSDDDYIKLIMDAYATGAISMQTAVELNPLIKDKEQEIERLREEKESSLGDSFNIKE